MPGRFSEASCALGWLATPARRSRAAQGYSSTGTVDLQLLGESGNQGRRYAPSQMGTSGVQGPPWRTFLSIFFSCVRKEYGAAYNLTFFYSLPQRGAFFYAPGVSMNRSVSGPVTLLYAVAQHLKIREHSTAGYAYLLLLRLLFVSPKASRLNSAARNRKTPNAVTLLTWPHIPKFLAAV